MSIEIIPLRIWFESRDETGQRGIGNITLPGGRVFAFDVRGWRGVKTEGVAPGASHMLCTAELVVNLQTEAEVIEFQAWRQNLINGLGG